MKNIFSTKNYSEIIYASGMTRSQLGQTYAECLNQFQDLHIYESDIVMCESSMKGYCAMLEKAIYESYMIDPRALGSLFDYKETVLRTMSGKLKCLMGKCKVSGTLNTTIGNTLVYAYCIAAIISNLNRKRAPTEQIRFKLIVGSDDAILLLNYQCEQIFTDLYRLGLETEYFYRGQNPINARFYSGRFVRVLNVDTKQLQYVHMPLLGKAFAKATTRKTRPGLSDSDWLRETMKSRERDYNYTPILRKLIPWAKTEVNFSTPSKLPRDLRNGQLKYNLNKGSNMWAETTENLACSPMTLQDIAEAYSITVKDLTNLESRIESFLTLRTKQVFTDPILRIMLEADLE